LLKLRNEEGKYISNLNSYYLGFSKIIENGYDEDSDIIYIVMQKLDEDLSSIINQTPNGKLNLSVVINLGLEMVIYFHFILYSYKDLRLFMIMELCTEILSQKI